MTWVKLDDQMVEHPKCVNLTPYAWTLWLHGLCYCSRNLTDGHIPHAMLPRLSAITRAEKAAAELVDAGLWHDRESGWEVHDYLSHQRSAEQVRFERAAATERKRAERSRRDTPNPQTVTTEPVTPRVTKKSRRDRRVTPTVEVETESDTTIPVVPSSANGSPTPPRTPSGSARHPNPSAADPLDDFVPANHPPREEP
jgi:hypothetical protein